MNFKEITSLNILEIEKLYEDTIINKNELLTWCDCCSNENCSRDNCSIIERCDDAPLNTVGCYACGKVWDVCEIDAYNSSYDSCNRICRAMGHRCGK